MAQTICSGDDPTQLTGAAMTSDLGVPLLTNGKAERGRTHLLTLQVQRVQIMIHQLSI